MAVDLSVTFDNYGWGRECKRAKLTELTADGEIACRSDLKWLARV